jgi:hypothetical protein
MPKGVRCSVADCTYWGQGNRCNADQIAIDIDNHASVKLDSEFAAGLGENHHDTARTSAATCCHTFKPKG